jgi:hypothetical protein
MPRVVDADVKAILDTDVLTDPFILSANLLVNQWLLNSGLSDALLTEIERWIAAHLTCMLDPRESAKAMGDQRVSFEAGTLKEGLAFTRYGQQAMLLDPTGILANAQIGKRTSFSVF